MKKFYAFLPFLGLFLIACEDDTTPPETTGPDPVEYTSGSADFSNYVAVGNSLTAGFSDNALFIDGQTASFPNMLASNFALVGGGSFEIPFMADNLGGMTLGGNDIPGFDNRLILSFLGASPSPVPIEGQGSTEISNKLTGTYNNMGVPGAKSYELLAPGYGSVTGVAMGTANPYFARFSSSESATVVGDAAAQGATFFTVWVGANDILLYATGGGTGVDRAGNVDPSTYNRNDVTDPNVFAGSLDAILQAMTANGADGAIANLPNVTDIPYFTTVPHNPIPLDAATAAYLNSAEAYGAYNAGLAQLQQLSIITEEELEKRTISFAAGEGNAVVIIDEDLTDLTGFNPALINMRQATADDLLVLTARNHIGTLADPDIPTSINGVAVPLADKWVLTPEEQTIVETALTAYNQTIAGLATAYDLAFVDANALLAELNANGFQQADGSVVDATFATGGGFSLDGVHPAPRGYAIVANAFIDAINTKYNSNLPGVNPLDYTGLYID
ncbi:MAG TPA: G-D-S-L family lipolytic protein [Muricauda sp.]|uniref:G-D-S-L family lipolytic protein n=1 Tax=Flagellimonas aurea TaxID=2915619 RepID=A0ABS3G6W9_9FLAO|nr:G-D-S-L family lipolytic protein [Allomuricauda aurea]MBO0354596.1 G-D-S-L family lipolytic protein [Allomuricauda aurea]UBZ12650.1 G-D-S-L family lipolytic protein [Allomuricauda aquimarina]HBU77376.1 G-D-S-L family lipolytic protein [Allomuricauda sp.]|tara:strand:- start:2363 stop:3871 length:1509 start_codon:yes stop_codon:yes gene_type:complete